jgi:hypothetical protein
VCAQQARHLFNRVAPMNLHPTMVRSSMSPSLTDRACTQPGRQQGAHAGYQATGSGSLVLVRVRSAAHAARSLMP